ncbi:hypothetical protein ACLB2K_066155 [Fragaria x ananassa]
MGNYINPKSVAESGHRSGTRPATTIGDLRCLLQTTGLQRPPSADPYLPPHLTPSFSPRPYRQPLPPSSALRYSPLRNQALPAPRCHSPPVTYAIEGTSSDPSSLQRHASTPIPLLFLSVPQFSNLRWDPHEGFKSTQGVDEGASLAGSIADLDTELSLADGLAGYKFAANLDWIAPVAVQSSDPNLLDFLLHVNVVPKASGVHMAREASSSTP